jgi:hypothetical protein
MSSTANKSSNQTHFKHLFIEISKWHQTTGLQGIEKLKNRCEFSKVIRKLIQTHNADAQQLPDDSVVNSFLAIAATRFPELKNGLVMLMRTKRQKINSTLKVQFHQHHGTLQR